MLSSMLISLAEFGAPSLLWEVYFRITHISVSYQVREIRLNQTRNVVVTCKVIQSIYSDVNMSFCPTLAAVKPVSIPILWVVYPINFPKFDSDKLVLIPIFGWWYTLI